MNFALAEMLLPLRFRPETPMSDEELMRFCAANVFLRVPIYGPGEQPETLAHPSSIQGRGLMAGSELVMQRIWE
jgi:hypothetical protein